MTSPDSYRALTNIAMAMLREPRLLRVCEDCLEGGAWGWECQTVSLIHIYTIRMPLKFVFE
jgi:hypothetical protein